MGLQILNCLYVSQDKLEWIMYFQEKQSNWNIGSNKQQKEGKLFWRFLTST